ncbi:hypothetical protein EVAR_98738_1 [Eumeta japonica]|uniref:Uncharacterized protein n=1 Tax=Eumeta variegata TaxID=151549 RepID=A0A4C1YTW3_EUMVA|nr:hypothetical protein EVAR_98738_1 [Eumeta japonica]
MGSVLIGPPLRDTLLTGRLDPSLRGGGGVRKSIVSIVLIRVTSSLLFRRRGRNTEMLSSRRFSRALNAVPAPGALVPVSRATVGVILCPREFR